MSENTWMLLLLRRYACSVCTVVLMLLLSNSVSLARRSCDASFCAFPAPRSPRLPTTVTVILCFPCKRTRRPLRPIRIILKLKFMNSRSGERAAAT